MANETQEAEDLLRTVKRFEKMAYRISEKKSVEFDVWVRLPPDVPQQILEHDVKHFSLMILRIYLVSPWREMSLEAHNLPKRISTNINHWKVNRSFRAPGEFSQHVTSGLMAWCLFVHHSTGCQ